MRWILGVWLLVNSSSALAGGAYCGDREEILRKLEEKFQEVVEVVALTDSGALVEWTVAPGGGWSMIITNPNQVSCIVGVGDSWESKTKVRGIRV